MGNTKRLILIVKLVFISFVIIFFVVAIVALWKLIILYREAKKSYKPDYDMKNMEAEYFLFTCTHDFHELESELNILGIKTHNHDQE